MNALPAQPAASATLQKPNFIAWHYAISLPEFTKNKIRQIKDTPKTFNVASILKNFFAPYKRLSVNAKAQKFGVSGLFDRFTFNLTSIFVGASTRTVLLLSWILATILLAIFNTLAIVVFAIIPLLSLPKYLNFVNNTFFEADFSDSLALFKKLSQTSFFKTLSIFFTEDFAKTFQDINLAATGIAPTLTCAEMIKTIGKNWLNTKSYLDKSNIKLADFNILVDHIAHVEQRPQQGGWQIGKSLAFGYTNTLDKFCIELTAQSLPPPAKEKILLQIEKVILRPSANNVLLVGEPGVGRHTTLISLASAIQKGQIPSLSQKRVMMLDAVALIGTAKNVNEIKANFEAILSEAKQAGNVILAIDAVDQIVTSQDSRIDFSDVLTAILTDNSLPIIGITTIEDFNRYVRSNSTVFKLFEKIEVAEPERAETIDIVISKALEAQRQSGVKTLYDSVLEIVDKSTKLIAYRKQPDKSIVLLNDAISQAKSSSEKTVTVAIVDSILAMQTKVPVGKLTKDETEKLKNLEAVLHKRIIGQDEAVIQIAKAMRRARAEIEKGTRPIGSFLFLGPTGVGKTETAKALSEVYFGSQEKMVRFDMTEYQGDDALQRLIGDADTKNPGHLATQIAQNPFGLLLVDEFEKSNRDVQNLFLQILDEGLMTDAFGKKVSFDNVIIIATSNAAAEFVREQIAKGVGGQTLQDTLIEYVLNKGLFSPELLNRFDAVVVYHPLSPTQAQAVTKLMLQRLAEELKSAKNITIEVTDDLASKIAQAGFDVQFGARPIRRLIADKIEDGIAKMIIDTQVKSGDTIPATTLLKFLN